MTETGGIPRTILRRGALILFALCCSASAPPASSEQDVPDTFGKTLDVVVVEVEAVVTDLDGRHHEVPPSSWWPRSLRRHPCAAIRCYNTGRANE